MRRFTEQATRDDPLNRFRLIVVADDPAMVAASLANFVWVTFTRANPAADIRAPKAPKRLPRTLDADRMARLLEPPADDPLARRDHAMMELLYSSGLRLAELVGVDLTDIDLGDRTVRVLGKGSKTRIVPVGQHAVASIQAWLRDRGALAKADCTALFVGSNGGRLGVRGVQQRSRSARC